MGVATAACLGTSQRHVLITVSPGTGRQQTAESSSKLGVEHRVNDRVEEAVDVAEPYQEREQCRVNVADRTTVHLVTDTDGVNDV